MSDSYGSGADIFAKIPGIVPASGNKPGSGCVCLCFSITPLGNRSGMAGCMGKTSGIFLFKRAAASLIIKTLDKRVIELVIRRIAYSDDTFAVAAADSISACGKTAKVK